MKASELAKLPKVREIITLIIREYSRSMGKKFGGVVMDGRDIGTVIFPDALCKIFLTASPFVRATRRFEDIQKTNPKANFDEIYKNLKARDEQDTSRGIAPLSFDSSYEVVDSSNDSIEATVARVIEIVKQKTNYQL
jgi:cytidylate kinase